MSNLRKSDTLLKEKIKEVTGLAMHFHNTQTEDDWINFLESLEDLLALQEKQTREEMKDKIKKLENKQLMLMRDDEAIPVVSWKDIEEVLK